MTEGKWEQLSFWTDEELGLQGPKEIEKTVAIQLQELREAIAKEIEAELGGFDDQDTLRKCATIARGQK